MASFEDTGEAISVVAMAIAVGIAIACLAMVGLTTTGYGMKVVGMIGLGVGYACSLALGVVLWLQRNEAREDRLKFGIALIVRCEQDRKDWHKVYDAAQVNQAQTLYLAKEWQVWVEEQVERQREHR